MELRELIRLNKPASIIKLLQTDNTAAYVAAKRDQAENAVQGSALFFAIENNASLQIIEILLENGYATVINRIRTIDGKSALEIAISLQRNDVALLLLRYDAKVEIFFREPLDAAILRYAAKEGAFEFAKLFMRQTSIVRLLPIEAGNIRSRSVHSIVRGACLSQKASRNEKIDFLSAFLQYLYANNVNFPSDLAAFIDEVKYLKKSVEKTKLMSEALRLGAEHEKIDFKNFLDDPEILVLLLAHAEQVFGKDNERANAHDIILEQDLFENVRNADSLNVLLDFYDVTLEMDDEYFATSNVETKDPLPPSAIANDLAFRSLFLLKTFLQHPKIIAVNRDSLMKTGKPIWRIADVIDILRNRHYVPLAHMIIYLPLSDDNDFLGILEEPGLIRQEEDRSIYVYLMNLARPEFSEENGKIINPEKCMERLRDFFHAFTIERGNNMFDLRLFEAFILRLYVLLERFRSSAQKNYEFLNSMQERDASGDAKLKKFATLVEYTNKVSKFFDLIIETANYVGAADEFVSDPEEDDDDAENNAVAVLSVSQASNVNGENDEENQNVEYYDRPVGILAPLIHARILKSSQPDKPQPPQRYSDSNNDPQHRFSLVKLGLVPFDVCIDRAKLRKKDSLKDADWPVDSLLEVVTAAYFLCPDLDYFEVDVEKLCKCLHNRYVSGYKV